MFSAWNEEECSLNEFKLPGNVPIAPRLRRKPQLMHEMIIPFHDCLCLSIAKGMFIIMIKFDQKKAQTQIRELRALADVMERNKRIPDTIDLIKTAWGGENSELFLGKCEQLNTLMRDEITHIRNLAKNLEQSAKTIADAEKKAQEALKTNTVRNT